MLLRRITEHVKAQNWMAIVLDFAIVVVGVFIGIQVSNWNDDRLNESRTQTYYKRLIDDLESERRGLVARLDYLATVEDYGEYALDASKDPAAMRSPRFLIAAYQASQIWTYSVQRATYDEILSSGVAEIIPDPELRTRLANYFLNAEAVRQVIVTETPYRQRIRIYLPNAVQAAVRENCSDRFIPAANGLLILELPERCAIEFSVNQINEALRSLDDYSMFQRELGQRLASIAVKRAAIEAHFRLLDALVAEIKRRRQ